MGVRPTKKSLEKVGVTLISDEVVIRGYQEIGIEVNANNLMLMCNKCHGVWSPNLLEGGKLPRGWWKCPNNPEHTKENSLDALDGVVNDLGMEWVQDNWEET